VTWKLKPSLKGKLEVAKGRGGPFKISWEVHGRGDRKIVVSHGTIGLAGRMPADFTFCYSSLYCILEE
jgi:hypothetical protein